MDPNTSTLETLARLSSKPGVQSTLILSRHDGMIIRSSGFVATENVISDTHSVEAPRNTVAQGGSNLPHEPALSRGSDDRQQATPEEIARAVHKYVTEAENLTRATGSEEDIQLLRLRTKKQEIVIVPDQKYLMVVIQDVLRAS